MNRKEERKQVAKEIFPNEGWEFQRVSFVQGAEWADKTMLERACVWLAPVFKSLAGYYSGADLLEDFKKAMEE